MDKKKYMLKIDIHDEELPLLFSACIEKGKAMKIVCDKEEKKQMFLEILCGKRRFFGDIRLDGISIQDHHNKYLQNMDVIPKTNIETRLSVLEFIKMYGILRKKFDAQYMERMEKMLTEFQLIHFRDMPLTDLPKEKQKAIRYIVSFLGNPVLLLIEDYDTGEEWEEREKVEELLKQHIDSGNYVIFLENSITSKMYHKHFPLLPSVFLL